MAVARVEALAGRILETLRSGRGLNRGGNAMRKAALVLVVVTLSGCASTREEAAIAFHQQSPQLVADCNMAFRDGSQFGRGIVVVREGVDACDRLADKESLNLVDPVAVNTYRSYRLSHQRLRDSFIPGERGFRAALPDTRCSGSMCSSTVGYSNTTPTWQQAPTWPDLPPGPVAAP